MWSISGYGQQIAELLPMIRDEGYPLAICNFYGQEGGIFEMNGIINYSKINHPYGSDAIVHHARDFKADVTITLQDVWILNPPDLQQTPRWIPYVPIDHDPCQPAIIERLHLADRIITYSKFGQNELKRFGLWSHYIPHSVDTEVYKPMDKKERKRASGLPEDMFLCGMVAANKDNPPRKSFQEVMDAFKMFLQKEPRAYLYMHTNPEMPGGFPIRQYAQFIGIQERMMYPDNYQMNFNTGKKSMAEIYNTFDVLLAPSTNEGFGVPIIEAQACGVPVIVNNFTAMPELVDNRVTGEICEVAYKRFDALGSYVGIPSTKSIYDCLVRIKESNRAKMGEQARKKMVENYDTKHVYKTYWSPYLQELEQEIYGA